MVIATAAAAAAAQARREEEERLAGSRSGLYILSQHMIGRIYIFCFFLVLVYLAEAAAQARREAEEKLSVKLLPVQPSLSTSISPPIYPSSKVTSSVSSPSQLSDRERDTLLNAEDISSLTSVIIASCGIVGKDAAKVAEICLLDFKISSLKKMERLHSQGTLESTLKQVSSRAGLDDIGEEMLIEGLVKSVLAAQATSTPPTSTPPVSPMVQGLDSPPVVVGNGLENVRYQGVIRLVNGYNPPLSCREHMLEDLPQVHIDNKL